MEHTKKSLKDEDGRVYFQALISQIGASTSYLNQTITWQTTIFMGSLVVLLAQKTMNPTLALVVVCLISAITTHHASRAAKAYLNVMRFSHLKALMLKQLVKDGAFCLRSEGIADHIDLYDQQWYSPLRVRTVLYV